MGAELLAGSSLARRVVALIQSLRRLRRPITQAELAARAGCHPATVGRIVLRGVLVGVIERDRTGPGWPWRWRPDPDLSAADGPRPPRGWVPLAVIDRLYAALLWLEPLGNAEAAAALARAVAADYHGRLRRGATIGGLARDAGLSERRYRLAEARLVEAGYLTRVGPRGRWTKRLEHPDGPRGVILRRLWKAETRRWARRARPAVCGRYGAARRWHPIGSRASTRRPLYTQSEPSAWPHNQRSNTGKTGAQLPEAAGTTKVRGPPGREVEASDLDNHDDPDRHRWQVLSTRPDWSGPDLKDVVAIARWCGSGPARAAALDVDHRIRTNRHPVLSPAAMTAALAWCYTAEGRRCRWEGEHDCGPSALVADRSRRWDEQADRWRQARADWFDARPEPGQAVDEPPAPLDDDDWSQLVDYLVEQGQTSAADYNTWEVPAEFRAATA